MIQRTNEWLDSNRSYRVVNCETILATIKHEIVDTQLTNYRTKVISTNTNGQQNSEYLRFIVKCLRLLANSLMKFNKNRVVFF